MQYSANSRAQRPRRSRWLIAFLVFVFAGILLLLVFGSNFVLLHKSTYISVALWSSLALSPFAYYRMSRSPSFQKAAAVRYPTNWIRNGISMPLTAILVPGVLFIAPVGWLAAMTALAGSEVQQVGAIAIEVGGHSQRKGCDQHATLRFISGETETCLDGLYPPAHMQSGQALNVGITTSPFGFRIVSIEAASEQTR